MNQNAIQASLARNYNPATRAGGAPMPVAVPDGCNRCTVVATAATITSQVITPQWQGPDLGTAGTVKAPIGASATVTPTAPGMWNGVALPRGRGSVLIDLGATSGSGTIDVVVWFWSEQ